MGALAGLYSGLFKRTSTFTLAICVGAVGVSLNYLKYLKSDHFTKFLFSSREGLTHLQITFGRPKIRENCGKISNTNMKMQNR